MTPDFDEARHEYRVNGRVVPHVTGALSVLDTYAGVPDSVLRRKAEIGTAVHKATELVDDDDLDDDALPDVLRGYIKAYRAFLAETQFKPAHIECRVYSSVYGYAGTFDRIGHFGSLRHCRAAWPVLVDYKATYTILPAVGPQTAAYERAWNEANPTAAVKRRFALQLKPDGTYRLHQCGDPYDWAVFSSALTIFNWRNRHTKERTE